MPFFTSRVINVIRLGNLLRQISTGTSTALRVERRLDEMRNVVKRATLITEFLNFITIELTKRDD